MGKRGPKTAIEKTPQHRAIARLGVAFGLSQEAIAMLIYNKKGKPISARSLGRIFKHDLNVGKADATFKVAHALYKRAMAGSERAQIFFLEARAGWARLERQEVGGIGGGDAIKHDVTSAQVSFEPGDLTDETTEDLRERFERALRRSGEV